MNADTATETAINYKKTSAYLEKVEKALTKAGCALSDSDDAFADAIDDVSDEITGRWVDNGIGAYEYWGARGVDRCIEFEVECGSGSFEIEWHEEDGDTPCVEANPGRTLCVSKNGHDCDLDIMGTLTSCTIKRCEATIEVDGETLKRDLWHVTANYEWTVA